MFYVPSTRVDTKETCNKCMLNMEFIKNSHVYLGLKKNEMKSFLISKADTTLLALENLLVCGFTNLECPN